MKFSRRFCACFLAMVCTSIAHANSDIWDGNGAFLPSGIWDVDTNWLDNTTPGNGDTVTFNLAKSYTVTVDTAVTTAIRDLFVTAGDVTLANSGSATRTLNVTSASGGQNVLVSGFGRLRVGSGSTEDFLNLNAGGSLTVQTGGTFTVYKEGQVTSSFLNLTSGGNVFVSGVSAHGFVIPASLNASVGVTIGDLSGTSTLTYDFYGRGSLAPDGTVNVGVSSFGCSGILNVTGIAYVEVGSLYVGSGPSGAGTINVDGDMLIQKGSDSITVGSSSSGGGTINIDDNMTTGTGLFTINKTGTVNIGSHSNYGVLTANGDVTVNGGILQRGSGGMFQLADGKRVTIQNGAGFRLLATTLRTPVGFSESTAPVPC